MMEAITTLLIFICAALISALSYSLGKTIRYHEDKLRNVQNSIDQHEVDINRLDSTLSAHIAEGKRRKKTNFIKRR